MINPNSTQIILLVVLIILAIGRRQLNARILGLAEAVVSIGIFATSFVMADNIMSVFAVIFGLIGLGYYTFYQEPVIPPAQTK